MLSDNSLRIMFFNYIGNINHKINYTFYIVMIEPTTSYIWNKLSSLPCDLPVQLSLDGRLQMIKSFCVSDTFLVRHRNWTIHTKKDMQLRLVSFYFLTACMSLVEIPCVAALLYFVNSMVITITWFNKTKDISFSFFLKYQGLLQ